MEKSKNRIVFFYTGRAGKMPGWGGTNTCIVIATSILATGEIALAVSVHLHKS
jgi:hypothetical protein